MRWGGRFLKEWGWTRWHPPPLVWTPTDEFTWLKCPCVDAATIIYIWLLKVFSFQGNLHVHIRLLWIRLFIATYEILLSFIDVHLQVSNIQWSRTLSRKVSFLSNLIKVQVCAFKLYRNPNNGCSLGWSSPFDRYSLTHCCCRCIIHDFIIIRGVGAKARPIMLFYIGCSRSRDEVIYLRLKHQ